jgi:hypothetical protein
MEDLIRTLPKLLRIAGETEEVLETAALIAWRRAAGEGLRTQAIPFRLFKKTLIVAVADATWQKQLEAISGQLLFRINSLLGQAVVTYIEFRIDAKAVRAARIASRERLIDRARAEQLAMQAVSTELSVAAGAIHDDELRRRFLIAAGSCINRYEKTRR